MLVEPAFNHFTPLPDGPLRTQILQLAADEHVHLDDVLVADASRRTTTLNAYVSGYGSTRRVVLYDNVVHDLPRDQILAIVAHELGHAHHDDVLTGSMLARSAPPSGSGCSASCCPLVRRRPGALRDPTVVPLVARSGRDRDAAVEPGEQRPLAADRDPRRRRLAADDARPRGVHRDAAGAGPALAQRPAAGLVAVLVRLAPDDAASGSRSPEQLGPPDRGVAGAEPPSWKRRWPRIPHGSAAIPRRGLEDRVSSCRRRRWCRRCCRCS